MAKGDTRRFLRAFLTNPTSVGAIAPSSAHLARRMVDGLNAPPGETVLEFGPGTGAFTGALRDQLRSPESYLGIEINEAFVELLRSRFADLTFVQGSAADAPAILDQHDRGRVRAIICGLPFASLPVAVQEGIVAALDTLIQEGAEFRAFQYVHAYILPNAVRFRRRMNELFGPVRRSRAVLGNLPPAYVLTWRRDPPSGKR